MHVKFMLHMCSSELLYHVKSSRKAHSPSAVVTVEGRVMILPAILD
uniref:ATSR n=1 Tax=Arundo donax TaxID=35708 RepID=A0A0A9BEK5_ARUDO